VGVTGSALGSGAALRLQPANATPRATKTKGDQDRVEGGRARMAEA
jgi:hypothetical protein